MERQSTFHRDDAAHHGASLWTVNGTPFSPDNIVATPRLGTVDLGSGDQAEVLLRFDGYQGKYVFHCHNLEHEVMMMMANFHVTG